MKKFSPKKPQAFSLIELSIVILIIGIIVASIIGGKKLVTISNLSKARALTNSSPVAGIEDLGLWLETTSKDSFLAGQNIDGAEVLTWRDINPQNNNKRNATGTTTFVPIYTDGAIKGLPALRFDGVDNFFNYDGSFLPNTDFTIFVLEQRRSAASNNFMIGSTGAGSSLLIGYPADGFLQSSVGGTGTQYGEPTLFNSPNPRIRTLIFTNSTLKTNVRVNGNQILTNSTVAAMSSYANPAIGRSNTNYFNGDIGEIIMYSRAISDFERDEIEKYLAKKWGIKLL